MNSDVPSLENELSQDGSSGNNSNENSVSSHTTNEPSNQVELSDNSEVKPQLKDDSINTENDQSSIASEPIFLRPFSNSARLL